MASSPLPRGGTLTPLKKLISEKQLAEILGVSSTHLGHLRKRRVLPYIVLGKTVRYEPDEVRLAIDRLTVRPPEVQA
jgi:hypothetical protein